MAARLRKHHQDEVKTKIQVSQLINYLQNHALNGEGSANAATRVRAAQALLNKIVPDVTRNEHSGIEGAPIVHRIEQVIIEADGNAKPSSPR